MRVKIPATSANLGPGFDCLGMSLNLYNYIEFDNMEKNGDIMISIQGEGQDILDKDGCNLTYQAYKKVFDYLELPVPGIRLNCHNNIPLARGLGSSAAAVVGGILIANQLLPEKLEEKTLLSLAVELEGHPDNVAPALLGGIVISGNSGQGIIYKKIKPPKNLGAMVIVPDYQLSTTRSREVLPLEISYADALFNVSRVSFLIDAFHTADLDLLAWAMEDRLHHPFRSPLIPEFEEVLVQIKKMDLLGAAISGAGPSILVFYKKEQLSRLYKLSDWLKQRGMEAQVLLLDPTDKGADLQ